MRWNVRPGPGQRDRKTHERKFIVRGTTVGEVPAARLAAEKSGEADNSRRGLALRPLTPEERRQADNPSGLRVGIVSGPAARTSRRRSEIVLSVNGQPVRHGAQLRALLDRAGKDVALLIERDNAKVFVPLDIV